MGEYLKQELDSSLLVRTKIIVLDFDGTLTDIDKEAAPAINGWKEDLARDIGYSADELESEWQKITKNIIETPFEYGWMRNGKIVAPSTSDPYMIANTITPIILDKENKYVGDEERNSYMYSLFAKNNSKSLVSFKEDADEFLERIKNKFSLYIVTNSDKNKVVEKISKLPGKHGDIPVFGGAKKYELSDDWNFLPESIEKEGFERPLYLRRKKYYDVLENILKENKAEANQVIAIGDIYELDLLLPEYLCMNTVLVPRENTPTFEINATKEYPKSYVEPNLINLAGYLENKFCN